MDLDVTPLTLQVCTGTLLVVVDVVVDVLVVAEAVLERVVVEVVSITGTASVRLKSCSASRVTLRALLKPMVDDWSEIHQ